MPEWFQLARHWFGRNGHVRPEPAPTLEAPAEPEIVQMPAWSPMVSLGTPPALRWIALAGGTAAPGEADADTPGGEPESDA